MSELVDGSEEIERFDESTYNKRLEEIKSFFGDKQINADSVMLTVRKS